MGYLVIILSSGYSGDIFGGNMMLICILSLWYHSPGW